MKNICITLISVCFLCISLTETSFSQPVSLDYSFADSGVYTVPLSNSSDVIEAIALQPDGKILLAGYVSSFSNTGFGVMRLNTDGTPDSTFGVNGIVIKEVSYGTYPYDMVLQPDGKIIITGFYDYFGEPDFCAIRLNPDGGFDSTFSDDGVASFDLLAGKDYSAALVLQNDGKIVVAGLSQTPGVDTSYLSAIRLQTDGTLDTTFNNEGAVFANGDAANFWEESAAVQSDGKIIIGGNCSSPSGGSDYIFLRITANGLIDSTFGGDGIVTRDVMYYDQSFSHSLITQADDKILFASYACDGVSSPCKIVMLRFNADGTPDNSFDLDGIVVTDLGSFYDIGYCIVIDEHEKIIVGGSYYQQPGDIDFALVRYNIDGSIDAPFGTNGVVITDVGGGEDIPSDIAVQTDGKLLLAGLSSTASDYWNFAVVRYDTDIATSVDNHTTEYSALDIFPNPFSGSATLQFFLETKEAVIIELFDLHGKKIKTIEERILNAGNHTLNFNAHDLPAGIFLLRFETGSFISIKKLIKQ